MMLESAPSRWTITDLTRYIRQTFEHDYRLQAVEVVGEVSNLRIPASGHAYFTLKDADAQLKCVMWKNSVQSVVSMPADGERVIAKGQISVYEAGGQYQLYCTSLQPAGQGDLHAQFEALRDRLQAEGLFDAERKQPLPPRPHTIGIVTSASTAALQDVLNVLRRRYPLARVILSDTPVQGDQAPPAIVSALAALNAHPGLDVILLVRGGGSLEDLWCFNDERVVHAIASSVYPVVTGIGHEIDFTLADFAADLRAPTPSAAAEQVTPYTVDHLRAALDVQADRLYRHAEGALAQARQSADRLAGHLDSRSPAAALKAARQQVEAGSRAARRAAHTALLLQQERVNGLTKALAAMNPDATLARGYAIAYDAQGRIVTRTADTMPDASLHIRLMDGTLTTRVETVDAGDTSDSRDETDS